MRKILLIVIVLAACPKPTRAQSPKIDYGTTGGAGATFDYSGSAHTLPAIVVASSGALPATCKTGELAFVSGASAGQQIYDCSATNTWTQQVGGGGLGSVNCTAATGSGTTTVSVTFTAGANCSLIAMPASGLVTVTLPTPSNVAGEFFLIFTNAADTTTPNLTFSGATSIGLPTGIAASNHVTVARMAWNSTTTTWEGGSNVDASATPLTVGQIPAAAALGPPVAATAANIPYGSVTYTSSHALAAADNGLIVAMNCSSACSVTLPNPQPSTTFRTWVTSVGSTLATVALGSTMTYNGGASLPALNGFRIMLVQADTATATNYKGEAPIVCGSGLTCTPSSNAFTMVASGGGGIVASCAGTMTGVTYQCAGTLTSTQILNMFATPVTVVTGQAGSVMWPTLWVFQSGAGTLYSGGGDVALKWTDGNTALFDSPLLLTTFNNSLSIYGSCGGPGSTSGTCNTGDHSNGIKGTGLEITNTGAAFTGGSATATYLIQYIVLSVN